MQGSRLTPNSSLNTATIVSQLVLSVGFSECSHDTFAAPVRNHENHQALSASLQPNLQWLLRNRLAKHQSFHRLFSHCTCSCINSLNPGGCNLILAFVLTGAGSRSSLECSLSLSSKDGGPSDTVLVILLLRPLSALALGFSY